MTQTPLRTLVIGGTGMLAGAVEKLVERGDDVAVLARRHPSATRYTPISADYGHEAALASALAAHEAFDLIVCWMHGDPAARPVALATTLRRPDRAQRFVHVLGSATASPDRADDGRRAAFETLGYTYDEVILGFVLDGAHSRWLTHAEISAGTWEAVQSAPGRLVVGVVEPWNRRP